MTLYHGDCLEVMRTMPDCSVDSVVTDPPYGLSFMGKRWDYDVPSVDIWRECLRVLKPGGHLLAFAGTRTQHRMAVRIEDAGFEIRDMIAWVYGSGFPKSQNVGKAIDKAAGAEREVVGVAKGAGSSNTNSLGVYQQEYKATAPATPEAQQWGGWGTALKPSLEPVTVARKPFKDTVAQNVLTHGTGAINIDGCRVASPDTAGKVWTRGGNQKGASLTTNTTGEHQYIEASPLGRWPANLIHDGSDEVVELFPEVRGQVGMKKNAGGFRFIAGDTDSKQSFTQGSLDSGSAARFFYTAKASRADREDGNTHPTVKPTDLMRYLCRLVTPPCGIVLDPFMGSGSTGKAAMLEGFEFIGIERDADSYATAERRINRAAAMGHQPSLL